MGVVAGFVGCECEDIAVYLAKIFVALGKNVAIVDRTEQEILLEIFQVQRKRDREFEETDCYGICITNQAVCYEAYDMVFLMFGYRLTHPKLYECEFLIAVTDGMPAHASLLSKIGNWDRKQYLLIRNLVPMKHTVKYLAALANHETDYDEITYEEQDIRMKYSLGSYENCLIKKLSAGMKQSLISLVAFLWNEYPERNIREIMKKL